MKNGWWKYVALHLFTFSSEKATLLSAFLCVLLETLKGAIIIILIIAIWILINKNVFIEPMEIKNEKEEQITAAMINRNDYDCYLINLEKNTDRLKTFTTYYSNSDLNSETFNKVKAIYGKYIDYSSFISPKVELNMTPGMVGCFLSHLEVYKKIINGDKPYALIFEDDARMIRNIQKSVIEIIPQFFPSDWDIILLGYDISNPVHHEIVKYPNYIKLHGFYGTHAYLITKSGAEKLLELVKIPFTNQIDHVMGELCELGLLNVYGIPSPVVWQEARFTDVQTNPE
jgi:glycosyl transferase family 25